MSNTSTLMELMDTEEYIVRDRMTIVFKLF